MTTSRMKAVVIAVAFEIHCPNCLEDGAIPAEDGSFMWDRIPAEVTCRQCGGVFKIAAKPRVRID